MKTYIDNTILNLLKSEEGQGFYDTLIKNGVKLDIRFGWPSLILYIGLESLFEEFPGFDKDSELFSLALKAGEAKADKDVFVEIFDQLFVECLTHVKALEIVNAFYLLDHLRVDLAPDYFKAALQEWKDYLLTEPKVLLHDLTLFLAWDRVCTRLAILFEQAETMVGFEALKECLAESFQHITKEGATTPGFFRLMEAFYAIDMREENLQQHPEEKWNILSRGAQSLSNRGRLADVAFIDQAIVLKDKPVEKEPEQFLTLQPFEKVQAGWELCRHFVESFEKTVPGWPYILARSNVLILDGILKK